MEFFLTKKNLKKMAGNIISKYIRPNSHNPLVPMELRPIDCNSSKLRFDAIELEYLLR